MHSRFFSSSTYIGISIDLRLHCSNSSICIHTQKRNITTYNKSSTNTFLQNEHQEKHLVLGCVRLDWPGCKSRWRRRPKRQERNLPRHQSRNKTQIIQSLIIQSKHTCGIRRPFGLFSSSQTSVLRKEFLRVNVEQLDVEIETTLLLHLLTIGRTSLVFLLVESQRFEDAEITNFHQHATDMDKYPQRSSFQFWMSHW